MKKNLCEWIVGILDEEGIIVQPYFEENFVKNAVVNYGGEFPQTSSIRAVIRMCNYWKRYCSDENEFSKLVCAKINSMAKIHAAAITSNQSDNVCYIGNLCKLREGAILPEATVTSASYGGETIIQQGFGAIVKKI